jgi:hypothetical protein
MINKLTCLFKKWIGINHTQENKYLRNMVREKVHEHRNVTAESIHESRKSQRASRSSIVSSEEAINLLQEARERDNHERRS